MAFSFSIPRTRPLTFESIFQLKVPDNIDHMKIATSIRHNLVQSILNAQQGLHEDALVSALQAYIPYVIALSQQVSKSKVVLMHQSLDLQWSSSLLTQPRAHERDADRFFTTYHLFPEENAQCHVTLAITMYRWAGRLHRDLERLRDIPAHTRPNSSSSSTHATTRGEKRKEVVSILRQAAGIFHYLATELIPSYHECAPSRPPDTTVCCCESMKWMCLALAQEITLDTAMESGTSMALCAKLAQGVAEKYGSIKKLLVSGMGTEYSKLDNNWNIYLNAKAEQYEAISRKYLAYVSHDNSEYGTAVAYLAQSSRIFQSISIPTPCETANPSLIPLAKEISQDRAATDQEHKTALADNARIYFGLVPSTSALAAPTSTFMMTPIAYTPPEPAQLTFFDFIHSAPSESQNPSATETTTIPATSSHETNESIQSPRNPRDAAPNQPMIG